MPIVWIPPLLRDLTGGETTAEVSGGTVRQVLDALEARYPGVKERLCDGDRLRPGMSVAVDGDVTPLGLRQRVSDTSEVHFIPAISGGERLDIGRALGSRVVSTEDESRGACPEQSEGTSRGSAGGGTIPLARWQRFTRDGGYRSGEKADP